MKACNDKMRTRRHFFTRAMTKRQEEEQRFDIYDLVTFLDKKDTCPLHGTTKGILPWPAQIMEVHKNGTYTVELFHPENPPPYRDGSIVRKRFTRSQVKSECIRHWDTARREGSEMLRVETRMKQYLQSVKEAQASITPRRGRKRKTPR
jgi:hypothetical protein